jgi:hypothetical protein
VVVWWRRGRPRPAREVLVATVAGMLGFAVVAVLLARPYLRVLHDHPEARRTLSEVVAFSGGPQKFLAASEFSRVWGAATAPVRDTLNFVPEQTLFPGLATLVLALVGLWAGTLRRGLRIGLGIGVLTFAVLSLGVSLGAGSWLYPYRWLYELLPGWQGIRVPGRLHTFTTLGLALLAAGGAQAIVARVRACRGALAAGACAVALCAAVLAEGWGLPEHPTVPQAPPGQSAAPQPALHLPMGAFDNRRYVLWSTDGFPRLVNGRASFIPRQYAALIRVVASFPDARSVGYLRRLGVRSVTVHPPLARRVSAAPLRGLGLERQRRGGVVRFVLR